MLLPHTHVLLKVLSSCRSASRLPHHPLFPSACCLPPLPSLALAPLWRDSFLSVFASPPLVSKMAPPAALSCSPGGELGSFSEERVVVRGGVDEGRDRRVFVHLIRHGGTRCPQVSCVLVADLLPLLNHGTKSNFDQSSSRLPPAVSTRHRSCCLRDAIAVSLSRRPPRARACMSVWGAGPGGSAVCMYTVYLTAPHACLSC